MILQIVDNTIKPEMKEEYLSAARDFAKDSSENERGCLGMEVWLDEENPDHVYIISRWSDQQAMSEAALFLKYKPRLKPCFVGNAATILRSAD